MIRRLLLAALLALGIALPARAAVTLDAVGTLAFGSIVTTLDNSSLTVGAGSNRALIAQVVHGNVTGLTLTWDPTGANQPMTLIGTQALGGTGAVELWGLLNPASGNKTLHAAWTTAADMKIQLVSWTGVDQTSIAVSFPHFTSATATSTTPSITVTSATGNAVMDVVANAGSPAFATPSQTQTFNDTQGTFNAAGQRGAGAATVVLSWSTATSVQWASAGTDILAFGAGPPPCVHTLATTGAGC